MEELAGLARRRQRERSMALTKWLLTWRTQLSLAVALHTSRAILDALPKNRCDHKMFVGRSTSYRFGDEVGFNDASEMDEKASCPYSRNNG